MLGGSKVLDSIDLIFSYEVLDSILGLFPGLEEDLEPNIILHMILYVTLFANRLPSSRLAT